MPLVFLHFRYYSPPPPGALPATSDGLRFASEALRVASEALPAASEPLPAASESFLAAIEAVSVTFEILSAASKMTGGVLVLLNAKGASKLAERAPEPAEGLIDSWEAEVFREKLGTIPEI